MDRPRRGALACASIAVAALVALRAASAPPWPDDWDGIGFVLSIGHFDMDHFAPHAPGYPVYVALLRLVARGVSDPIVAANAVAVMTGALGVALAWAAARRAFGHDRALWIALGVAVAPLSWRAGTAIGSEAPALMFAALAVLGLTMSGLPAALFIGFGAGLGLGTRLSWAPLFVSLVLLAPRGARVRAWTTTGLATAMWTVPFVATVGARHLVSLLAIHGRGHWTRWGGTALSDPGRGRAKDFARDLLVDGLGAGTDRLGLVIAVVGLGLAKLGFDAWREAGYPHTRALVVALAPYVAWIAIAQNLRQQPRHALPLVVALMALLALAATSTTRARTVGMIFFALVGLRTFGDASERRAIAPAGAQLVERVRGLPDAAGVVVMGGPSARFFALTELRDQAMTVATLGEATLALGRRALLPARVLVTNEVEGRDRKAMIPFATLCRPPRLDRRAPCLTVSEWRPAFLGAPAKTP